MVLLEQLTKIFDRELDNLVIILKSYKNQEDLWKISGEVNNSAGNLTLHLIGNLNFFIGRILGHTDYMRDREQEFANKNIPLETILKDIEDTKKMVHHTIIHLNAEKLAQEYPYTIRNERNRTDFMLIHLAGHLCYHIGQIDYHRRLLGI